MADKPSPAAAKSKAAPPSEDIGLTERLRLEVERAVQRGLKAVDWDFEIENVDGGDFELSSIEFRPLILDRRTRG